MIERKKIQLIEAIKEILERDKKQPGAVKFTARWDQHLRHGGVRNVHGDIRDYSPLDVSMAIEIARSRLPEITQAERMLDPSLNVTLNGTGANLERTLNPLDALTAATRSIAGCRRCKST